MNKIFQYPNREPLPLGEIYGDAKQIKTIFYWFITLILLGLFAGMLIVLGNRTNFASVLMLIGTVPVAATYYLVSRQRFEIAAIFLSLVLILINTMLATNGLGIHHVSVLAYPAILIVASLVTKKRTMIFLTAFVIVCVGWLVFGELNRWYIPSTLVSSVPGDFFSAAIIITLTAIMIRVISEMLFKNFYQLQMELGDRKSAQKQKEELIRELEIRNAESETLRESLASIVSTFEFNEIIDHILDQIRRAIPYDSASVWKVEGSLQKLIVGRNLPSPMMEGNIVFQTDETNSALPILNGSVPYILNNNVQEELSDFHEEPHTYVNSWLAIPLKTRGKIIGIIALDGKEKGQFGERHAELAVVFANQVALALENSQLFKDLQTELNVREKLIHELEVKNAELERFTYTVSHDLKSPLVTITGFLAYLEIDVASNNMERFRQDSNRIRDAVNKMHSLLGELLDLSRIGRIVNPSQMIPFEELVNNALEIVHGQLESFRIILQPNLPAVYGDHHRLTEVLQNLLDNAAKFIGNQPNPQIEIGCSGEENDMSIFFVRDNGIGIPRELQGRIFGLFDKLDPYSEGSGVGLAIVKRIIEVHGGRIWVESEAEHGATFFFTLPKDESQFAK
ncbi:MAG: GAF domain-containing sensor histidine kinase [Anaerolineales bacterium]